MRIAQDKLYYLNDLKVEEVTDETGQVKCLRAYFVIPMSHDESMTA